MHARSILAITAIAFGLNAGLAQAQPQPQDMRDRDPRQGAPMNAPGRDARQPAPQMQPQHAPNHRPAASRPMPQPDHGRGAGPDHRFRKGERLPTDYRSRQYVVDDWRGHHLSAPPRGHRWVQVGADYVLIAVATGVITQIILGH